MCLYIVQQIIQKKNLITMKKNKLFSGLIKVVFVSFLVVGCFHASASVPEIVSSYGNELSKPKTCVSTGSILRLENLAAGITAKNSTTAISWALPASWVGGVVPKAGDDVTIPSGAFITLDQNVNVKSISIMGKLNVDPSKDVDIRAEYIMVMGIGALFQWGTVANPYNMQGSITLVGSNPSAMIPGHSTMNSKALVAMDGASLELHGKVKTSWSNLAVNASAGATAITIATNTNNWEVGDSILITSSRISWNEAEKRAIKSISVDKLTFTLDTPLKFPHIGTSKSYSRNTDGKTWQADIRAEVGLLSKSIKIQGDETSNQNGYGGHVMIHEDGIAHVEGVEFFQMGQKSIKGSYPFHWHLLQERGAGQYLKNSSIRTSYNRAVTIHGTESVLVENNFCYDHVGHGIFLEDGSERFNIIRGNVVALTKRPVAGEEIIPSDNEANEVQNRTPASYWITNPNNIFENNVAAGTQGTGFWFAMPQKPMGPSAAIPRFASIEPHKEPLGRFYGNKAHSSASGFDIFDQLTAQHALIKNGAWERTDLRVMDACTWYACDLAIYGGIGGGRSRTEDVVFRNNIFVDNVTSVMHANYSLVEQSVFVANSGEDVFVGERKLNRGYDGSCTIKDCHMIGWQASNANYVQNTGGAMKHVNYRVSGMTMDNPGPPRMAFPDYSIIPKGGVGANDISHPRFWSYIHWDIDGSLGGKKNTSIITNHQLERDGSEVRYENWTNLFRTDRRFAYMLVDATGDPKMTLVRTKAGTPKAGQYYINTDLKTTKAEDGYYGTFIHFPVIVNDGFLYTMQFESLGTGKSVNIQMMDDYIAGDQVLYRIKEFGRLPGVTVSNASKLGSLTEVQGATQNAFAVVGNDVYLKMVSTASTPDISCRVSWTTDITLPMLDTDGDGTSDYQESVAGTDPIPNDPIPVNLVLPVPTIKTVWEFATNGDSEGWSLAKGLVGSVTGGSQLLNINSVDPNFVSAANLMVPAENYTYLRFRIKSDNAGTLQVYFGRDGATAFSSARVLILPIQDNANDFIDYYIDMSTLPEWKDNIFQLRLDPEIGTGNNMTIDRISFEKTKPACTATITAPVTAFCPGGSALLSANTSPGAAYKWLNGGTILGSSATYTAKAAGSYTLEVLNASGCSILSSPKVVSLNALPIINISNPTKDTTLTSATVVVRLGTTSTNLKSVSYYLDGVLLKTFTAPPYIQTVSLPTLKTYKVKVVATNTLDCVSADSVKITRTQATALDNELFNSQDLSAFPNPSIDGYFNLSQTCNWKVYSILGNELKAGNSNLIDLSENPKGVYLIKMKDKIQRVVKE